MSTLAAVARAALISVGCAPVCQCLILPQHTFSAPRGVRAESLGGPCGRSFERIATFTLMRQPAQSRFGLLIESSLLTRTAFESSDASANDRAT